MDYCFFFVCFMFGLSCAVLFVSCSLVVICWEKGLPLDSIACCVLLCFFVYYFPVVMRLDPHQN